MRVPERKNIAFGETQQHLVFFLKQHHLTITKARIKILELFQISENALENCLIEKKTQNQFDRITVYRTLQAFLKKGIIHTIPTYDNSIRYALCTSNCGKTICLGKTDISIVQRPKEYIIHKTDAILTGVCNICTAGKNDN